MKHYSPFPFILCIWHHHGGLLPTVYIHTEENHWNNCYIQTYNNKQCHLAVSTTKYGKFYTETVGLISVNTLSKTHN